MDRKAFKAMTAAEADDHVTYWKDKSLKERLEAACYLINQAYGTTSQKKIGPHSFFKGETQLMANIFNDDFRDFVGGYLK